MITSGPPARTDLTGDKGNWDPDPRRREYMRHVETGELGWVVEREGREMIRLDRGPVDHCVPFRNDTWEPDRTIRRMSEVAMAQIAWAADCALLRAHGRHGESKAEWLNLSEAQRIEWVKKGPDDPGLPARHHLWAVIMDTLEDEVE